MKTSSFESFMIQFENSMTLMPVSSPLLPMSMVEMFKRKVLYSSVAYSSVTSLISKAFCKVTIFFLCIHESKIKVPDGLQCVLYIHGIGPLRLHYLRIKILCQKFRNVVYYGHSEDRST